MIRTVVTFESDDEERIIKAIREAGAVNVEIFAKEQK